MAETFLTFKPFVIAIAGGVLPALFWLWFWRREDEKSPEPTGLIALSFVAGIAIAYLVIPAQNLIIATLPAVTQFVNAIALKLSLAMPASQTVQMILWAGTEEIGKFVTVFLIAFHSSDFDEPLDAVIYLITAALGFTAIENTLYLLQDLSINDGLTVAINGNLRFMGATVVHIVSSSIVGITVAFSFYYPRIIRFFSITLGLILAILLHAYFNLSIIEVSGIFGTILVFSQFWIAIFIIIIIIHFIKRIKPNN